MIRTDLTGLDALKRAVAQQPTVVGEGVADAQDKTAFAILQRVLASVPVRTGNLKDHLSVKYGRSYGSTGTRTSGVTVAPEAFYWRWIEYGKEGVAPRPIFRQATDAEEQSFEARLQRVARQIERSFGSRYL